MVGVSWVSRLLCVVCAAALVLVFSSGSFAAGDLAGQESQRSEQTVSALTYQVSSEVLSPYCPGKTLDMCPSPAAAEVRRTIQSWAKSGMTKEEMKDRLIEEFGEEFRRITPNEQDDTFISVILVSTGLVALLVLGSFLSRRKVAEETNEEKKEGVEVDGDEDYLQDLRGDYKS